MQGKSIDVIFDSKTTSHVSNDIATHCDFLGNELAPRLMDILPKCKLVGHEPNMKLDKKPSAVECYYYEYKVGDKKYFFNIEENFITKENRHYYRLYALTIKLRDSVIIY